MASLNATPSTMTLSTPASWHGWLAILKASAIQSEIWEYIDPSTVVEPALVKPILPRKTGIVSATEIERSDTYFDLMAQYNESTKSYKAKKEALSHTLTHIHKSISPEYSIHIYKSTSLWQALRALKAAIQPNTAVRMLEVDRQYKILCAGPPRGQNLRQWINKWDYLYAEAKETGHADTVSGVITDYFISSVSQTASTWAEVFRVEISIKRSRNEGILIFTKVLNSFRQVCNIDAVSTTPSLYGATLQGQPPGLTSSSSDKTNRKPNSTRGDPPPKECVCGRAHWYKDCFYINETIRLKWWKPKSEIVKKIEEAMKDSKVKNDTENAKKQAARKQASTPSTPTELPTEPQTPANFATKWHHSDPVIANKP